MAAPAFEVGSALALLQSGARCGNGIELVLAGLAGRLPIGRNNWLFADSLRAGKRAAAIMSLVHSARLNGHAPYGYLRDVLEHLPTQPASRIAELLPHRWLPKSAA